MHTGVPREVKEENIKSWEKIDKQIITEEVNKNRNQIVIEAYMHSTMTLI